MPVAQLAKGAVAHRNAGLLILLLGGLCRVQAERLPIKTYTTADGLAHDRIRRIVPDSRGFLWFCTVDGLSRFDGSRFTSYGKDHGLPHTGVTDLIETRHGQYWVATFGGVCRFNPQDRPSSVVRSLLPKAQNHQPQANEHARGVRSQTDKGQRTTDQPLFTTYPVGNEPATNHIEVLYEDRAGRLWAGTWGGLFCLDEPQGQGTFRRVPLNHSSGSENLLVRALLEDRDGSLWIATEFGLARRLPDGRMVHYDVLVHSLLQDREGRLWLGGYREVFVFKPTPVATTGAGDRFPWRSLTDHRPGGQVRLPINPGQAVRFSAAQEWPRDRILDLHESSDGRIWIAVDYAGLIEFDGRSFRRYTTAHGLSSNWIASIAEDREGNLWLGTFANGAMRLARQGFLSYLQADGLENARILSIFEDQTRQLCAVSDHGFFHRLDGGRFRAIRPRVPEPMSMSWYHNPLQDHTGQWWVPTDTGLYRFPKVSRIEELAQVRPKAAYTTRDGLTGNDVFRLFEDSRGDVWIGTSSDTRDRLTRWERATQTFHRYTEADGLPPFRTPSAFCEDAAGNLWIGFWQGGLARYAAGRFTFLTTTDGVPAGQITTLFRDHVGRLWVGINGGGLARIENPEVDRPRLVTYMTAQGLASHNVRCITEDRWGRLYIGAGRGVTRLDPASGRMKHFTTADGLVNSYVNAAFRDRDGRLWFGTLQGISQLAPEADRPEEPPPVWINGLRIAGVPHPISELGETEVSGLELEPNQNRVEIDFVSLSFGVGETLRYQYKLEGADEDWSAPTDHRTVNYANLTPGTYRFLVRAVSADGLTSPTPATVTFRILPPIWQRWWFLVLVGMITGWAVYALHRYRARRLVELERVRTRIAADLHDHIGTGLSQMALLSEVVKQQIGTPSEKVEQLLSDIAKTGRELVEAMSDIVWAIDPRRDDLGNLIARVRQLAGDLFDAQGIRWELQTSEESEGIKLSPDQRRHLYLIFKEAITNIARHADCHSVWLSLTVTDHRLAVEIRDDGRGFVVPTSSEPRSPERQGNGLTNMHARAAELGGQLTIESSPEHGTRLTLAVPLK